MLTFASNWAFLLIPLPLLVWWLAPAPAPRREALRVPFFDRLVGAQQAGGASQKSSRGGGRWLKGLWLKGLLWGLVIVALARPQWIEPPIERTVPTRDLLLLVDLSASMGHEDFTNAGGNVVDRLSALKEVLGDFLRHRQGDRVGLVVFGNSPFLQVPFSTDLDLSKQLLDETRVGMAGPQTALGDAIGLGIQLFENSDAPAKTMIVLTDGNDTASAVPPSEAARIAADREITIHAIAMGDPTTVGEEKIDEEELSSVAQITGGQMSLALDRDDLSAAYQTLDSLETRDVKTVSHRPRREFYYFPVAVALVLSLGSELRKLIRSSRIEGAVEAPERLRVNPRTFQLEVSD